MGRKTAADAVAVIVVDPAMSGVEDMFEATQKEEQMSTAVSPIPPSARGFVLRAVSARRWRVIDRRGVVIGHVRCELSTAGDRFHAERFDLAGARLRLHGSFWTVREAVECLAYLR